MSTNNTGPPEMPALLPRGSAFGVECPGWNVSFPNGNLTAAEILAYLPNWLKSVDVVDRFVSNGGKAYTIAAMINQFRHIPGGRDAVFPPNSAQIMMSYNMRRAGFADWTVSTHHEFERPKPELEEDDLNVERFRTPRITHPKSATHKMKPEDMKHNRECDPVDFKALAYQVKAHPTGKDALDLTRCVQYAIEHTSETWYFPSDFEALVNKLGGPAIVTHSHLDRQMFGRRANYTFPSPKKGTPKNEADKKTESKSNDTGCDMPQSRGFKASSMTPASATPLKRTLMEAISKAQTGGQRKSGRLANKVAIKYGSDDTATAESPLSGYSTPIKKVKLARVPPTPRSPSDDGDFVQNESEPEDDDVQRSEIFSGDEEIMIPSRPARDRAAALKARQVIRDISTETQRNISNLKRQFSADASAVAGSPAKSTVEPPVVAHPPSNVEISAEMMSLAATFSRRRVEPIFLQPPVLSANRLRVDASTIYIYAAEGCTSMEQMWATALSSSRFRGPRRHAPFRELHRLSDPLAHDVSDWAENIRWAKEQFKVFGSETWTEYDYHLEVITEHRRNELWVSEEVVMAGM